MSGWKSSEVYETMQSYQSAQAHAFQPYQTPLQKHVGSVRVLILNARSNLKIPTTSIKTLMKEIYQNVINYMTYLVLNKMKLENKQATITPP